MEQLHQQVVETERRIHDLLDKPHESAAGSLISEVRLLESDLQTGKNLYSVEDRIKRIIHILEGEAKSSQIMNYEHLDMFRHWFEHLRDNVRSMR